MLKILERVELDRPILMKEKFEILWNMDSHSAESDHIAQEINKQKFLRQQANHLMGEKYKLLLNFIYQRYIGGGTTTTSQ